MATTVKDLRFSIYINNDKAKQSLIQMETEASKLKERMEALADAGQKDTDAYRALKKAYDEQVSVMDKTKKEAGLLSYSMKDLGRMAGYLRNALQNAVPGTEKYKAIEAELIVVERRMTDVREASAAARRGTESFTDKMAQMPGVVGVVGSSLQGLGQMLKTLIANPVMLPPPCTVMYLSIGQLSGLFKSEKYKVLSFAVTSWFLNTPMYLYVPDSSGLLSITNEPSRGTLSEVVSDVPVSM